MKTLFRQNWKLLAILSVFGRNFRIRRFLCWNVISAEVPKKDCPGCPKNIVWPLYYREYMRIWRSSPATMRFLGIPNKRANTNLKSLDYTVGESCTSSLCDKHSAAHGQFLTRYQSSQKSSQSGSCGSCSWRWVWFGWFGSLGLILASLKKVLCLISHPNQCENTFYSFWVEVTTAWFCPVTGSEKPKEAPTGTLRIAAIWSVDPQKSVTVTATSEEHMVFSSFLLTQCEVLYVCWHSPDSVFAPGVLTVTAMLYGIYRLGGSKVAGLSS